MTLQLDPISMRSASSTMNRFDSSRAISVGANSWAVAVWMTLVILLMSLPGGAMGQVEYVTNLDDSGTGSLREAIMNVVPGGTVEFDPSLSAKTINLTSGQLLVANPMTILAPDGGIVLDAGGQSRIMFLVMAPGMTLRVENVTFANGFSNAQAAGERGTGALPIPWQFGSG
jgi:hypothetical protein